MSKKPYLPNNWEYLNQLPSEAFPTPTFEEVMDMSLFWELPSSVKCVIRIMDKKTRKISESSYIKHHAAQAKVNKLMRSNAEIDVLIMEHGEIQHIFSASGDGPGNYG